MSRKFNAFALATVLAAATFASGIADAKPLNAKPLNAKPLARHKSWTASPAEIAAAKRRLDTTGTASVAAAAPAAKRCSDISCLQYMTMMGVGF